MFSCVNQSTRNELLIIEKQELNSQLIEVASTLYATLGEADVKARTAAFESIDYDLLTNGDISFAEFVTKYFEVDEEILFNLKEDAQIFIARYGMEEYEQIIHEQMNSVMDQRLKNECNCGQQVFDALFGGAAWFASGVGCAMGNIFGCMGFAWGAERVGDAWNDSKACGCWSDQNSYGHN